MVQWNEDLYEKQLIERTVDACKGLVDIVIDFGTTSRSLHRSLQCLNTGGIVLIGEEIGDRLRPKFSRKAEERKQHIKSIANGTIEELQELVKLVATNQVGFNNMRIGQELKGTKSLPFYFISDPNATSLSVPMRTGSGCR